MLKDAKQSVIRIRIRIAVNAERGIIVVVCARLLHRQLCAARNLQRHSIGLIRIRKRKGARGNAVNGREAVLFIFDQACPGQVKLCSIGIGGCGIGVGIVDHRLLHIHVQDRKDTEASLLILNAVVRLVLSTRNRDRILAFLLARIAVKREGKEGIFPALICPSDGFVFADA